MSNESCNLKVRVLSVCKYEDFAGEVTLATANPRFVVSLILDDARQDDQPEGSRVTFPVYRVAVFAIPSVVRLFIDDESEVVGNVYDLRLEKTVTEGVESYSLSRA